MAHYPQSATGLAYIGYPVGPDSRALTLVANASANTKGNYAEFVASSPFACNYVHVVVQFSEDGTANRTWLFDIATGAGGAETVRLPDMMVSQGGGFNSSGHWSSIPLAIAASTRIAGRVQSNPGGIDLGVGLMLIAAGDTPGVSANYVNYGSNTGDSGGVSIDPGGTVDTKGAYSQLTASTSAVIQALIMCFGVGSNSAPQTAIWSLDFATGAGGAEVVLIPDLKINGISVTASNGNVRTNGMYMLTYIAASTRLAARASCNINDATDRLLEMAILGATAPTEAAGGGGSFTFGG